MRAMRFIRHSLALGATGLFSGLAYHNISGRRQHSISAAGPVNLDIEDVISADVKSYIANYAPVMKHGFPSYDSLRIRGNFVLSYDRRNRVPNWVMEYLTADMIDGEACGSRGRSRFYEDDSIHDYFRSTLDDYKNSGYDRGHLAAAANHKRSQRELDQTFVLSNIIPQDQYCNQGIWERLECHVRNLAREYGGVYVCSGPLYLPRELNAEEEILLLSENQQRTRKRKRKKTENACQPTPRTKKYIIYEVIGENNVAVPTHFFKIILCEVKNKCEIVYDMEAYIIPNERIDSKEPLKNFMVPRNVVERAAGLLFFNQLPIKSIRKTNGEESDLVSSDEDMITE